MQVFFTNTPFVPIYMAELNFEIQTSNFDRDFRHTNFKFFWNKICIFVNYVKRVLYITMINSLKYLGDY